MSPAVPTGGTSGGTSGGLRLAADALTVQLQDRTVLDRVSVGFEPGRIAAVVGPNGAGKSTLLKTLAGLLPAAHGRVTLGGRVLGELDRRERARALAFLPQERSVHWPLAVRAVVALGRLPHRDKAHGESPRDSEAIEAAMRAMDVAPFAARSVQELSGGERARVLFARALAQEAPVLLADEPTAGLDPAHALALFATLQRLAAEGRTVVVALHDLSLAARFCHDAIVLRAGRVLASGGVAETLTAERLSKAFGVAMGVGRLETVPVVVPLASKPG